MLPIPVIKTFPKLFRNDPKAIHLAGLIDADLTKWRKEVLDLLRHRRFDECDRTFLPELAAQVYAVFLSTDTDKEKRTKIRDAVLNQKLRCTWPVVKALLDDITGYSAVLKGYDLYGTDDWIAVADVNDVPAGYLWGCMDDGTESTYGVGTIQDFTEPWISGNVYIDAHDGVHTAVLSAAVQNEIVAATEDDVFPAYFRVFVGYIDGSGTFQIYKTIG